MSRTILNTALQLLDRFVGFDTTSRRSNLDIIDDIANRLDGFGYRVEVIPNEDRSKANLLATIGPEGPGGLILSGHTDVVPVDGQQWSSDPFRCTERSGKLFGRGTADMKSFLACCVAVAGEFRSSRYQHPVHLAFSFDEELACLGVPLLIAKARDRLQSASLCVVGEPTSMRLVLGHKGVYAFHTEFEGVDCHSSTPENGVSAVLHAADFACRLRSYFDDVRAAERTRQVRPTTSFNIGTLQGGTALNIVPRHCQAAWEFRPAPLADAELIRADLAHLLDVEMLGNMRMSHPAASIRSRLTARVPPLAPQPDHPAIRSVQAVSGLNFGEVVDFGTEAGLYQEIGVPTVVCGPGSIEQAHRADEFIEISQISRCIDFIRQLVGRHLAA